MREHKEDRHWNYQWYREQFGDTIEIAIREVYYDASGRTSGITERGVGPMGESIDKLREDMAKMRAAFDMPILSDKDFQEGGNKMEDK